jgi:hypothetical protein
MQFHFNERKAAQAAAYLLHRHGGTFNYMHLLKLLYLADRKKLLERGTVITGDRMYSMEWGPSLSKTLERTKAEERAASTWRDYISPPAGYNVKLRSEDFDTDELSPYERQILDQIDGEYGGMDVWDLSDWMHRNLKEYEHPGKSSKPIPPERILRVEGRKLEEVEEIAAAADAIDEIDSLIAGAK